MKKSFLRVVSALFLAVLASCGGGGGGGGGGLPILPPAPITGTGTPQPSPAKYTIGGTVTGLSDGDHTLVLQNNYGDDLTLKANGDFTFLKALDEGVGYAVAIRTQPLLHLCTVSNATGKAVADVRNVAVVCAKASGKVTTLAGSGKFGRTDDTGIAASFNDPTGIAVDASGNIYVSDTNNHLIRKVTPAGKVTTLAGAGFAGSADGMGSAASFSIPNGIAVDVNGNVYVADTGNHLIRKITPTGNVTTLAGSGSSGKNNGTGTAASFNSPSGVAADGSGNVYVADIGNHLIRKITPSGEVTTAAGSGIAGSGDGIGTAASFNNPTGIAIDLGGNIYVTDQRNHLIRKITPSGQVSTLAGSGSMGNANGTGAAASFRQPQGVAVDTSGNVYVADWVNNQIRKINPSGGVSTLAGTGTRGKADGTGATASFDLPEGVAVDAGGNVYVADSQNNLIRKIAPMEP